MNFLNVLLIVKDENRTKSEIIIWWEVRRILYNVIVLVSGILSMNIMTLLINLKPGEDLEEPLGIIFFAFACNLFYTIGWLSEISEKRDKYYGPKMFKRGLYFTLFFVFLPAVLHIIFWIGRGFTKMN